MNDLVYSTLAYHPKMTNINLREFTVRNRFAMPIDGRISSAILHHRISDHIVLEKMLVHAIPLTPVSMWRLTIKAVRSKMIGADITLIFGSRSVRGV